MLAHVLALLLFAAPATRPGANVTPFTAFEDPAENDRWRMVNDNVMGGRSLGDVEFEEGVMTFAGSINTNGGGFSSVRMRLREGELEGVKAVRLRIRTDGKPYRLLIQDDTRTRGRNPSHRALLTPERAEPSDDWQTVEIEVADLSPSWRGNPMTAPPLDVERATVFGITLVHDVDGPFELQVDSIDLVRE